MKSYTQLMAYICVYILVQYILAENKGAMCRICVAK